MRRARAATAVLLLALAGAARAEGEDPMQLMAQLEARVLAARRVAIEATIESRGFIASNLKGRHEVLERNRASVAYAGEFAGKPADLSLAADGRGLHLKNGADERRDAVAREANRALLVGLLRMGLLHNLARLTMLQPPDHGEGGVETWVVLDSYRPTTFAQGGELEGAMSFGYDLVVAGNNSGSVRLWLDPATGLPRRRMVTVRFPQGEMQVFEEYTRFVVE